MPPAHVGSTLPLSPFARRSGALGSSLPHLIVAAEAGRPFYGALRIRLDRVRSVRFGRGEQREIEQTSNPDGWEIGVVLRDGSMSSQHATVLEQDGETWVQDHGSSNGTFVHRGESKPHRVQPSKPARLHDGDWIEMGRTFVRFRASLRCRDDYERVVAVGAAAPSDPHRAPPGLASILPWLEQQSESVRTIAARPLKGVVVYGETGTGKELVARALHLLSPRRNNRFVPLNCGRLDKNADVELFGVAENTFSNAKAKDGFIARSEGGTLFLDEIGKLSLDVQSQLLRAVENGEVQPVGSDDIRRLDPARLNIVSAANEDLDARAREGAFLPDLLARISGTVVRLPPFRERVEDLALIVAELLIGLKREGVYDRECTEIVLSHEATRTIVLGTWNWNMRGLREALRAELLQGGGAVLGPEGFEDGLKRQRRATQDGAGTAPGADATDERAKPKRKKHLSNPELERRKHHLETYAREVVERGQNGAKTRTAAALGITPARSNSLNREAQRLNISREDYDDAVRALRARSP